MTSVDLKKVLEVTPDAMLIVRRNGQIAEANEQAANLTGYSVEELTTLTVDNLVPSHVAERHRALRESYAANPHVRQMGEVANLMLLRKDASKVPVDIRLSQMQAAGEPLIVAAVRDMSLAKEVERRLRTSEERFRGLTMLSSDWYWEQDKDLRFTYISESDRNARRCPASPFIGKTRFDLKLEWESEKVRLAHKLTLQERLPFRDLLLRDPATDRWFRVSGEPTYDESANFSGYRGVSHEVTEQRRVERAVRESEQRFRSLTQLSSDWYWEQDADFRFTFFSETASDKMVLPLIEMLGKSRFELPLEFESEAASQNHLATLLAHRLFRDLLLKSRITGRWISASGEPVFDSTGNFIGYRGVARDVTDRKQAEERNEFLATRDTLTGLPNRTLLQDRLQMAIFNASRSGASVALFFIDLDRFKLINDTLGHDAGDAALREVAGRLGKIIRKGDTLARLGGDEFVMLIEGIKSMRIAEAIAAKAVQVLSMPLVIDDKTFLTGASVGVAIFPDDGNDSSILMRHADMAMYQAKSEGRSRYRFFSKEINQRVSARVGLERDLRHALDNGDLALYFQPQFAVSDMRLVGAEVLLRWQHQARGPISPAEFIPIAEESGLIVPIGEQVLTGVCNQVQDWLLRGYDVPRIAVNVSAKQIANGQSLLDRLTAALSDRQLAAGFLEFEITESLLVFEHEHRHSSVLQDIAAHGVRIAIDDFGTGYSSLSYLRRLPIHAIKVDRSFVSDIVQSADAVAIVRAILALAKSLGLDVTAEGVETPGQLSLLQDMGCDSFQGYLKSPPIPAEEFCQHYLAPAAMSANPDKNRNRSIAA